MWSVVKPNPLAVEDALPGVSVHQWNDADVQGEIRVKRTPLVLALTIEPLRTARLFNDAIAIGILPKPCRGSACGPAVR